MQMVSMVLAGATIGSTSGSGLADGLGRRKSFLLSAIPLVLGSVLCATAGSATALLAGRFLCGMGIGLTSAVTPVYISEVLDSDVTVGFAPGHSSLTLLFTQQENHGHDITRYHDRPLCGHLQVAPTHLRGTLGSVNHLLWNPGCPCMQHRSASNTVEDNICFDCHSSSTALPR